MMRSAGEPLFPHHISYTLYTKIHVSVKGYNVNYLLNIALSACKLIINMKRSAKKGMLAAVAAHAPHHENAERSAP